MIDVNEIKYLTKLGTEEFEKNIIEGPLLKNIISSIETAAIEGYMVWKKTINKDDSIRELKVIQKYLKASGFKCEFEEKKKRSLIGEYTEHIFTVDWSDNEKNS